MLSDSLYNGSMRNKGRTYERETIDGVKNQPFYVEAWNKDNFETWGNYYKR